MFNWWSTDSVIMPAKEEHECDFGSESLDKHKQRDILHCHGWKTWSKFRCCRKGRTIGSTISSLWHSMFLEQFWAECDHHDKFQPRPTLPPPKRSKSYTQWSVRTFPTSAVQTITSIAVICRCLRIGPTTGRLTRSPDSRSFLWTVWPKIGTLFYG